MRLVFGLTLLLLFTTQPLLAQGVYSNDFTPEGWVLALVRQGKEADLNKRCAELAKADAPAGSADETSCRTLRHEFVEDIAANPAYTDALYHHGFRIKNAIISGDVNLESANVTRTLSIVQSTILGNVDLESANVTRNLSIKQSAVNGALRITNAKFDFGFTMLDTHVAGNIDARGVHIARDLRLTNSSGDNFCLQGGVIDGSANLINMTISNDLNISNTRIGTDLLLQHAQIGLEPKPDVAPIDPSETPECGDPSPRSRGHVYARALNVGGNALFEDLNLKGPSEAAEDQSTAFSAPDSKIGIDLWLSGTIKGHVSLVNAHVGSTLHILQGTYEGDINLTDVRIDNGFLVEPVPPATLLGPRSPQRIVIAHSLIAPAIHVLDATRFNVVRIGGSMDLRHANFNGDLTIADSYVAQGLVATGMHVSGDASIDRSSILAPIDQPGLPSSQTPKAPLDFSHAYIGENLGFSVVEVLHSGTRSNTATQGNSGSKGVDLSFTHIGGFLDLSGARLHALDLSRATIDAFFQLSPPDGKTRTCWYEDSAPMLTPTSWLDRGPPDYSCSASAKSASLSLVDTHIATLFRGNLESWPHHLTLSGFTYNHIGIDNPTVEPSSYEHVATWREWLDRDSPFSLQPYSQLANVMVSEGDRETANEIQFAGRERQRERARQEDLLGYLTLTMLWATAGYGIGSHTWRALSWVFGLAVMGGIVVYSVRSARHRGIFWPLGASLERILPLVQLDKSFTEFFERQEGFRWWHKIAFCILALFGSALGLFLAAAVSGLTQKG